MKPAFWETPDWGEPDYGSRLGYKEPFWMRPPKLPDPAPVTSDATFLRGDRIVPNSITTDRFIGSEWATYTKFGDGIPTALHLWFGVHPIKSVTYNSGRDEFDIELWADRDKLEIDLWGGRVLHRTRDQIGRHDITISPPDWLASRRRKR